MKYSKMLKSLLDEAFGPRLRNSMPLTSQLIWGILLLPITISYLFMLAYFYCIEFALKGLAAPYEAYHQFLKKAGSEVRHGTEVLIYAVAFPFLAVYHATVATFNFALYTLWFCIMILTCVLTLGGVRWQPFLTDATFGEVSKEAEPMPETPQESAQPESNPVTASDSVKPNETAKPVKAEAPATPKQENNSKSLSEAKAAAQKDKEMNTSKATALKNTKKGYATYVGINGRGNVVCPICEKSIAAEPDALIVCPDCKCIIKAK